MTLEYVHRVRGMRLLRLSKPDMDELLMPRLHVLMHDRKRIGWLSVMLISAGWIVASFPRVMGIPVNA
jgi:hypothetical protein